MLDDEVATEIAPQIHDEFKMLVLVNNGFAYNEATTLIFSAKETIFKVLFPIVQAFFGFESFRVKSIDTHRQIITFAISDAFSYKSKVQKGYIIHYKKYTDEFLTSLITTR